MRQYPSEIFTCFGFILCNCHNKSYIIVILSQTETVVKKTKLTSNYRQIMGQSTRVFSQTGGNVLHTNTSSNGSKTKRMYSSILGGTLSLLQKVGEQRSRGGAL